MQNIKGTVWSGPSASLNDTIAALLETAELKTALAPHKQVIIKPNLVEALDPPITTPAPFIRTLVHWLSQHCPHLKLLVAEGTGSLQYDTFHCFRKLDYLELSERENVKLVDLNLEPSRHLVNESCSRWPEMYLPDLIFESYLISVPVLKAHSMSGVTLTMKNMMGCAPPAHYKTGGGWGKAAFHERIHEAVFDLNRYRTPDFTVMDCSIGMAQAHLWGPTCNPPVGRVAAAYDPVAIDAYGTSLLGKSWRDIGHIRMAHKALGTADPIKVIEPAVV